MSKAFTSEETPEVGVVARPPVRLAPGEVRYMTPEGFARLQAALAGTRDDRSAAAALPEVERQARLDELDARIAQLEALIGAVTVLGPEETPEGTVGFGTWVSVEDEDGNVSRYRIVGPDEAEPKRGWISVHSPVARALVGRSPGDAVEVQRPGGAVELTVIEVTKTA